MVGNIQREFFRIELDPNISGHISILKVWNQLIESKKSEICILDIGGGGLSFTSA